MANDRIISIVDGFRLYAANSLEEYRCSSFFSKEPETVAWIESLIQDGDVFYDVGANIGVYAIYAAFKHPRTTIYGFEPFRSNFNRMCDNIALNLATNITPLHFALSDIDGIETFYVKDDRIGASGSQVGSNVDERGNPYEALFVERVPVLTMDRFLNIFQIPPPNHIKIDVDGIEEKILTGMEDVLNHPALHSVMIEVNLLASNAPRIKKIFTEKGFRDDHPINALPNHSRNRRQGTVSEQAENILFVRP